MRSTLLLAVAALGVLTTAGSADAYWWNGAGVGVGGLYRSLDYPTERRVPYFAAHPPVYYSQPVPRTYGYSPFAYTPDTRTPDVVSTVEPVEIVNPYVTPSSATEAAPKQKPAKRATRSRTISTADEAQPTGPLTIINPYVVQGGEI